MSLPANVSVLQLQADCDQLVDNLTNSELEAAMAHSHELANDNSFGHEIVRVVGIAAFSILGTEFKRRKDAGTIT